uniref:Glycosyltransferases n=1 Tax=Nelumbo nucifera TaxID=4432 RepID=A0A822YSF0_NELNU|nr:TPA_asm: hypothetical protein HUJ06_006222 [Nelumbo nucifera]
MASIRRTLSPVPRAGAMQNGEAHLVASPLSKSSSCSLNHAPSGGLSSSLLGLVDSHSSLYRIHSVVLGFFSHRSSRPLERSKSKGQSWRRAFLHFFICFMVGIFIGFTPFVSMSFSINLVSKHQAFSFELIPPARNVQLYDGTSRNEGSLIEIPPVKDNSSMGTELKGEDMLNGISDNSSVTDLSFLESDFVHRKLLIVVTPTQTSPFQAYYLNRLAHTLRLVPPPMLWIVVEMSAQSTETADILRRMGVMYRHLVCDKNLTSIRDRRVHQRNVALSHIETHRLDGIVYFADYYNMYSVDLFAQLREIRYLIFQDLISVSYLLLIISFSI